MKKQTLIYLITVPFCVVVVYYITGYLNSYIGWYGYDKWKDRKHSMSINESIGRKIFVKKLNYRIDSFNGKIFTFEPFIEKGFRWGHNTMDETKPITNSNYPYQLSYNYRPTKDITILMPDDQFIKFDSSNRYLVNPQLSDTIILNIEGEGITSGVIKVW